MNTLYSFARFSRVCTSRSACTSVWARYCSTLGERKLKPISEDGTLSNKQKLRQTCLTAEERERILVAVKQVVAERDASRAAEAHRADVKARYVQTIKHIEQITGRPVPPGAPKKYVVRKASDKRRKLQQRIPEVLLSKFHKHTPIEEIKLFLEAIGLHPKRIELEPKARAQYLNAYVILPDDEIATALQKQRLYFKYGTRVVYFLSSPRANKAYKEKLAEQNEERAAKNKIKSVKILKAKAVVARKLLAAKAAQI